jgi:hypothetical protein
MAKRYLIGKCIPDHRCLRCGAAMDAYKEPPGTVPPVTFECPDAKCNTKRSTP